MARNKGEGWLRVKKYADGETVLFCYQTIRSSDGKKVENSKRIGLLKDFPTEKAQWREVERQGYSHLLNKPIGATPTFRELAEHWRLNELKKVRGVGKRAEETVDVAELNLDNWVLPKWGDRKALEIKSLELEDWFDFLGGDPQGKKKMPLESGTIQKLKSVMSQVYKHAQRHELIPVSIDSDGKPTNPALLARLECTSTYEAKVVSPEQMIVILSELDKPTTRLEWMLALLHAATALRPEETFGLKWMDVDWERGQINIRRGWSKGKETEGKTEGSMTQVVMHPALAQCLQDWRKESTYPKDGDWIFPSLKLKGKKPRTASCASQDYLRPAAVKAGVIPEGYRGRFGWHNLRHSLATFLGSNEVHPAVAQSILRHKKLSTTMEIYTHHVNSAQVAAQEMFLNAIGLKPASEAVN
jgi:integrase